MQHVEQIRFALNISADQYVNVYKGRARNISVVAEDGRRVEFVALKVKPFLTRDGIQGWFELQVTDQHRFVALRKLCELDER
jgi:hypothetical protein